MRKLYGEFWVGRAALGLLILRVVTGVALMIHGWPKMQNAFHWMDGMGSTPAVFQSLAALGEFAGGLGLIVGLLTPIAAFGIAATMVGAIFIGNAGAPWINSDPKGKSFELASLYLLIAVAVMLIGPGLYSLDAKLFGKRRV